MSDTLPMPLHDVRVNHQIELVLSAIAKRYPHIAKSIRTFWGFQEGVDYLRKLIFDCSDPKCHIREGFKAEVLAALLTLQTLKKLAPQTSDSIGSMPLPGRPEICRKSNAFRPRIY